MVDAAVAEDVAGRVVEDGCAVADGDGEAAGLTVGIVFMGAVVAEASFSLRGWEL